MPRRLPIAALAAVLLLAGCGRDVESGDTASLVPSESVLYVEVTLDPDGGQEDAARALLERLPGDGEPQERLSNLLNDIAASSDEGVSYKEDVEPWLGDSAAFFVSNIDREGGPRDVAGLVATEDESATRDFLDEVATSGRKKEYEGVGYRVLRDGTSVGVFDDFLVIGTEGGLKAAVDTGEADSLAESGAYERALADIPEERVGLFWSDTRRYLDALPNDLREALGGLGEALDDPSAVAFVLEEDAVVLDGVMPVVASSVLGPAFGAGTESVGLSPADSLAALGAPDLGPALDSYLSAFAVGFGDREFLERELRKETGLDLREDVLAWMGDYRVFVSGESVPELGGAFVVKTKDPAASRRAIAAIERVLRREDEPVGPLALEGLGSGFSVPVDGSNALHVFQTSGDDVVVAYGDEAAADAVQPQSPLSEDDSFATALESLGEGYEPSAYVDIQPLVSLIEGASEPDAQYKLLVKPYLALLDSVVSGTREEGDALRWRLALRFR